MHRIEEPEEKKRVANESVEGLMMDIAAAEEEIIRWKSVAEQEAAAGRAVEQEFLAQIVGLLLSIGTSSEITLSNNSIDSYFFILSRLYMACK
ncbi:hypothetical protein ERO13_D01G117050v2 [Gossypium hirsutum]|uniref:Uncharacterized protein n=1 Tax=Gossypium mustelinum TaxID=34275 RepID=A0A5D2W783_GOSMU|nr:hypothetical protein ERO13_D01G117050v2 [Gossypium hirsutum]TYI97482.1 hypothetical protein E1A91_D01G146500v1 [Gossypium mustelinum]